MQGEEEVLIATNAMEFETKNSKQLKSLLMNLNMNHQLIPLNWTHPKMIQINNQEQDSSDCADLDITTMHANQSNPLPRGNNAHIINSFSKND
jgi:hypothetical protein